MTGSGGHSTCLMYNVCFSGGDLLFECPESDERCNAGGNMPEVRQAWRHISGERAEMLGHKQSRGSVLT